MGGASGGVHNIISTNGTDNTNGKFRTTTRLNVLPSPPPSPSGSRLSLGDDGPNSFNHLKGSWGLGKATRHSVACGGSEGGSMGAAHDPTSLSHTRRGGSTRLLRHPLGAEDCARKPPELDPHPPVPVLLHGEWQPARAEGFSEHGTCVGQRFCAPGSGQDYGGDRDRSPKPRGSRPYHLKPFGGGGASARLGRHTTVRRLHTRYPRGRRVGYPSPSWCPRVPSRRVPHRGAGARTQICATITIQNRSRPIGHHSRSSGYQM